MRTRCPHCGNVSAVPDDVRTNLCPSCHKRYDIIADARTVTGRAPALDATDAPTVLTHGIRVNCPECRREATVPADGTPATCPRCGASLTAAADEAILVSSPHGPGVREAKTVVAEHGKPRHAEHQKGVAALEWLRTHFEGRYEILEFVARGGMGAIYKARQLRPKRVVALKIMLGGAFASPRHRRRFQREAEAVARLNHPAIVPVYDFGDVGGQPFFTMEFVDGLDLTAHCTQHFLGREETCRMMVRVCSAVDYAHQYGIIHRDLKPGNIMVDRLNRPRILDFGLSRMTFETEEGRSVLTVTGDLVGTPRYMSPEQALAHPDQVDARTDVYALGAILYELLVGMLPYPIEHARSVPRLYEVFDKADPVRPSLLHAGFPRDLEIILLKAVAKDKEQRYRTAEQLAEDLENWLADRPISARRPSTVYRLSKWAVRTRRVLVPLSVSLAAFGIVTLVLGILLHRTRGLANETTRRAEQLAGQLERDITRGEDAIRLARDAMLQDNWEDARDVALIAPRLLPPEANVQGLSWQIDMRAERRADQALREFQTLVQTQDYDGASSAAQRLQELAGRMAVYPALSDRLRAVAARPDDYYWRDLQAAVDDALNGREATQRIDTFLAGLASHPHAPDAHRLAKALQARTSEQWTDHCLGLAERALVAMDWDLAAKALTAAEASAAIGDAPTASGLRMARLQAALASVLRPDSAAGLQQVAVISTSGSPVKAVAFSADGKLLAVGRSNGTTAVVTTAGWTRVAALQAGQEARTMALAPAGDLLAVGLASGEVALWRVAASTAPSYLAGHAARVDSLCFSPDAARLLSADRHNVIVWDLRLGEPVPYDSPGWRSPAALSPDGRLVAATADMPHTTNGPEAGVGIWDASGTRVQELPADEPRALAFHPDGSAVATGHVTAQGRTLILWDIVTGDRQLEVRVRAGTEAHLTAQAWPLAFSPDGRVIVTGEWPAALRLWDARTGDQLAERTLENVPFCAAVSPDCRFVVMGHNNGSVSAWGVGR
jgi:WD40 repeat protein/tRNA A-37 threonylcarbamoyl transferase component Bud32/ribosomal protein S27E